MLRFIAFFFVLVFSNNAFALCGPDVDRNVKAIENAYYVGIMKVLDVRPETISPLPENMDLKPITGAIYTIQPIQSWYGEEKTELFEIWVSSSFSGSVWSATKGSVFVNIIVDYPKSDIQKYTPERNFIVSAKCGEIMLALEKAGLTIPDVKSEAFLALEKECNDRGNKYVLTDDQYFCVHPERHKLETKICHEQSKKLIYRTVYNFPIPAPYCKKRLNSTK